MLPQLCIRRRDLPDSVACVVACPDGPDELLILLDEAKPNARAHLARLLAETALISLPVGLPLTDLLPGLLT